MLGENIDNFKPKTETFKRQKTSETIEIYRYTSKSENVKIRLLISPSTLNMEIHHIFGEEHFIMGNLLFIWAFLN